MHLKNLPNGSQVTYKGKPHLIRHLVDGSVELISIHPIKAFTVTMNSTETPTESAL